MTKRERLNPTKNATPTKRENEQEAETVTTRKPNQRATLLTSQNLRLMATDRHRPHRLAVPPRAAPSVAGPATASRLHSPFPYPSPSSTPSKHRLSRSLSAATPRSLSAAGAGGRNSLSFLFILLFSLRSFYSLLPFLRSSPSSFSVFPFSFLVSLLSFLLHLSFSILPSRHKPRKFDLSLSLIDGSQFGVLLFRSAVLAIVFLLRFQALRYCGTAAMILAELSGNVAFQFAFESRVDRDPRRSSKVGGFVFLGLGLFFLSVSWDRLECFPFSYRNLEKLGTSIVMDHKCVRIWPMVLPFLSGFLGCYERDLMNQRKVRQLGQKRIQLVSLFLTTVLLLFPAVVSFWIFEEEGGGSISNLGWPLVNTVVFGVLLNEWYSEEKNHQDFEKEFLVTFAFTVGLELVYFPELSLWGLLICGLLFWITVRQLNDAQSSYVELGMESQESVSSLIMKPIRHILSERKSRKIALFLLINALYMVVEFVAGFMSNSLGLISDACHMLFDCAALAIGLYASYISRLPANGQYNYGRGRFEVLSGYANAVFLVLVGALIVLESLERILDPQEVSTNSLLVVSVGGLLVNVVGLIFFHEEHHHAHGGHGTCSHSHSHSDHEHHKHQSHSDDCHHHEHKEEHVDDHLHGHHSHSHVHHHEHDHDDHVHKVDDHHHVHHSHDHHHDDHVHNDHHHDHSHSHSEHGLHPHSIKGDADEKDCCTGVHGSVTSINPSSEYVDELSEKRHVHIDHNMEGIFLHVLADTLGSVGVVISTLLIKFKGWLIADPACSIFISILIVSSVIPLLRNSAEILLQRIPRAHEQDLKKALNDVMKIKGVCGIQNVHVWSLTNADVVGTLHLHVSAETDRVLTKNLVSGILKNAGINDLTLQVECVQK